MQKITSFIIILTLCVFPTQLFAETVELVTYYPAQANMGQANLDAATIGNLNGEIPDPGELLVESRVRVGNPVNMNFEAPDSSLAIFQPRNTDTGILHLRGTDVMGAGMGPFPPGQHSDVDNHYIVMSQPSKTGSMSMDWVFMTTGPFGSNAVNEPTFLLARRSKTDSSGIQDWQSVLTMGWNGWTGISNDEPEAMLHVGSMTTPGDILLENPRTIMFRGPSPDGGTTPGQPRQVLSYTTYPNVLLSNSDPNRGGVVISANNDHNTGQIIFRTGLDDAGTPEDDAIRMLIANDGQVVVEGDLELKGRLIESATITAGNGDANASGNITALDALIAINHINNGTQPSGDQLERMDMNGDGRISRFDVLEVINIINTRGNGTPAGPLRQVPLANRYPLEIAMQVDTLQNVGVGDTPFGGDWNNQISAPPNNVTSGNMNVNDIYIRSAGQWASQMGLIRGLANFRIEFRGIDRFTDHWCIIDLNGSQPVMVASSTTTTGGRPYEVVNFGWNKFAGKFNSNRNLAVQFGFTNLQAGSQYWNIQGMPNVVALTTGEIEGNTIQPGQVGFLTMRKGDWMETRNPERGRADLSVTVFQL